MDEDVFSRLALDEAIPLCRVEPLHHTLFSAQLRHSCRDVPFAGCNASRWGSELPGEGPLHHFGITKPNQMRRNAGINRPRCPEPCSLCSKHSTLEDLDAAGVRT